MTRSKHKRSWLAPKDPNSVAYVVYDYHNYKDESQTMDIQIADCTRTINIHFFKQKDIAKLDKLIEVLQEARAAWDTGANAKT